jgi:hypothetical protein
MHIFQDKIFILISLTSAPNHCLAFSYIKFVLGLYNHDTVTKSWKVKQLRIILTSAPRVLVKIQKR